MDEHPTGGALPEAASVPAPAAACGLVFLAFGSLFAAQSNWVSAIASAAVVCAAFAFLIWARGHTRAGVRGAAHQKTAIRETAHQEQPIQARRDPDATPNGAPASGVPTGGSRTPTSQGRRALTSWEVVGHVGMAGLYVGLLVLSAVTGDSYGAIISAACALVALGDLAARFKRGTTLSRNEVVSALL